MFRDSSESEHSDLLVARFQLIIVADHVPQGGERLAKCLQGFFKRDAGRPREGPRITLL
jgi:hypothetical protein